MHLSHTAARATAGLGTLLVAAVLSSGCTLAGAPTAPTVPAAPAAEPSAPSEPDASVFTTQNGTMRLLLPAGWEVEDASGAMLNHDGLEQWSNSLTFVSPSGVALFYYDGHGGDVGAVLEDWAVVEDLPLQDGLGVVGWWQQTELGIAADVMLTARPHDGWTSAPTGMFQHEGIPRIHAMRMAGGADDGATPRFETVEQAEAWLAGPEAQEAIAVMSTVELLPVPQYAMPETSTADPQPTESGEGADASVLPEADDDTIVTTHDAPWTFTSNDGLLRLDLPGGWTVAETVRPGEGADDCFLGCTSVTMVSPTGTRLEFSDRSGDDAALQHLQFEEVERRTTPSGHAAIASWNETELGFDAAVRVESRDDAARSLTLWLAGVPELASASEAREFLAGAQAQEALDVMAGASLTP